MPVGYRYSEESKQKMRVAKLGKPTWNKGKTGVYSEETRTAMGVAKKGKPTWNKGKKLSPEHIAKFSGENNYQWKGSDASYTTKHQWIRLKYGSAHRCELQDETCTSTYHWSNKDHKYSRDISDWQQLCSSHHKRFDLRSK